MKKTKSSPSQRGSNFIYQALSPSLGLSKVLIGCCVKMSKTQKEATKKTNQQKKNNKKTNKQKANRKTSALAIATVYAI